MPEKSSRTSHYFYGFDYLRALMSLCVVALHLEIFGTSAQFNINEFADHGMVCSDILNYNFLMLAVPVFFLISLFLFFQKASSRPFYITKRIGKILFLYCFWVGLHTLFLSVLYSVVPQIPTSTSKWIALIMTGNSSHFYFFFSLMFLLGIAPAVNRLNRFFLWFFLLVTAFLLGVFPFISREFGSFGVLAAYWNPLNFLPIVFVAALLAEYVETGALQLSSLSFKLFILSLFVVFLMLIMLEWQGLRNASFFMSNGSAMPHYTRNSIVVGASILFCLALLIKNPPNACIQFLSKNSLGLYCLHYFPYFGYLKLRGAPESVLERIFVFFIVTAVSLLVSALFFKYCTLSRLISMKKYVFEKTERR